MSTDRDATRIVRSWLDEGVTVLPDRVLDAVLDQVPATPQRRATWWPVRRTPPVNKFFGVAVAAAAIVVAAVAGYRLLISEPDVGPPVETPEASPVVTSLTPANIDHQLVGGQYRFTISPGADATERTFNIQVTLPRSWLVQRVSDDEVAFWTSGNGGPYIGFFNVRAVYKNPCHPERGFAGQHLGAASSEDLVAELSSLRGFGAYDRRETTIAGLPTTHFIIANSLDTEAAGCTDGNLLPLFATWDADLQAERDQRTDNSPATNGGSVEEMWIVDRGSYPLLIVTEASNSDANRAALDRVLSSIVLE